jgi:hypothetical protein
LLVGLIRGSATVDATQTCTPSQANTYTTGRVYSIVTLVIECKRIYTTPEHPFSVNGQWIDASKLSIGDLVRRLDGSAGDVEAVTIEEAPTDDV